jgi:hypothetical protein
MAISGTMTRPMEAYIDAIMTLDPTDDEKLALVAHLRHALEYDAYRRPCVTESHTYLLTGAAALKKMTAPRGPAKFEQGGVTSTRRGARRPKYRHSRAVRK